MVGHVENVWGAIHKYLPPPDLVRATEMGSVHCGRHSDAKSDLKPRR